MNIGEFEEAVAKLQDQVIQLKNQLVNGIATTEIDQALADQVSGLADTLSTSTAVLVDNARKQLSGKSSIATA